MYIVLSVEVAVTSVWFATVLVLRFMATTLVFRTTFTLSFLLSRFSLNLMLKQASWRNVSGVPMGGLGGSTPPPEILKF
jgi:hypothetical protein